MNLAGLEHHHYADTSAGLLTAPAITLLTPIGRAGGYPNRIHGRFGIRAPVGDHHLTRDTRSSAPPVFR